MSDRFVVDASVVSKLYLRDEKWVEKADALFQQVVDRKVRILSPRIILYEVVGAISRATKLGRIDQTVALQAVRRFGSLPLPIVEEPKGFLDDAFQLANSYGCTFYDGIYLKLAEDLGWEFVTADERLYRQLRNQVSYLVLLSQLS